MEGIETPHEQALRIPRLGEPAPWFEAVSTHGVVKLEDYRGSWLLFFSHPADFTPVGTSEFISFSTLQQQFKELNCMLLGLSIDSVYSHIAWIRNIEQNFGVKIDFPVIADITKEVAISYGMIIPGANRVEVARCTFIIDDKQRVRTMSYYPPSTGRNINEILRLLKALQISDKNEVSTPANWEPGEKVISNPPRTQKEAADILEKKDQECVDWYFCKKEIKQ